MSGAGLSDLTGPMAHIVHIGAGTGQDLAAYLETGAKAITLIEAEPEAIAELNRAALDHPEVTVLEAIVSADTRERPFRRTNFPELNSFRQPTGLTELFPGLRVLSEDPVRPADPVRLITDLELSQEGPNLLVTKTPGESLGILQALEAAGLLLRFDAIRLQEARLPLYQDAADADAIRDHLTGVGYSAGFEAQPEDPDRPYLSAALDRAALQATRRVGSGRRY